ncbi:hypothetical protein ASF91_04525 [Rhizobium sp. Leaf155]|uniref:DUF6331 family protein n=1 Tax=Agrobacterium cavarae TaxID=2528239 RepID=UPI000715B7BD|nr:DUF6331 family protein [Agrobacterium cavarae]KQR33288.1 hypothetical protein ASF91_04525 [Rhizobium sp. Leaf155]
MEQLGFPPSISALVKECERFCEKECCGPNAFSFSPFNMIYHLTKYGEDISWTDIESLQEQLSDFAEMVRSSYMPSEKLEVLEINAILTVDQLVCLVEEIGFGLIQAHAIYAPYRDEIEDREWEFSRMLRATA